MLSRRKDAPKSSTDEPTSSSSKFSKSSLVSKNHLSDATTSTKGEKRKASNVDPYDEKGSEYLRRKHHNIKSSIRFDYQPDICKDYKETGFCGFGDSCKFLHDRSDYKHGWQLEQEWAKGQCKDKNDDKDLIKEKDDEKNAEEDKNICKVCKEPYKDPVMTKCKHYFCGSCADKECTDKCYECSKPTSGIFKPAKLDSILKQ